MESVSKNLNNSGNLIHNWIPFILALSGMVVRGCCFNFMASSVNFFWLCFPLQHSGFDVAALLILTLNASSNSLLIFHAWSVVRSLSVVLSYLALSCHVKVNMCMHVCALAWGGGV